MCGCGSSSPASRATSAPRSRRRSRGDGHDVRGFARSRERVAAAGVLLDELVTGDALTGAGLDRAMDGVEVAYYLIHSMEGAAGGAFPEQELRGAERFAAAAQRGRGAADRLPRRARAARRRRLAPPRLADGGRGGAAGSRARVDRAARLDRDRRPLALVPLPRAADRAAARAGAARLARTTARGRSTAATCSPTSSPPRPRRPRSRGRSWDIAGPGRHDLRAADRADRRRDARRRAASSASASR